MADEGRDVMQQLEVLQQQMQQAQQRLASLEAAIVEIQQAIATLEAIQDGEAQGEVLFPIGGGVQVRAQIHKDKDVMFDVGAETTVEGSIPAALGTLGTRRDQVRQSFEQTAQRLQQMSQMAQDLQQRLSSPAQ